MKQSSRKPLLKPYLTSDKNATSVMHSLALAPDLQKTRLQQASHQGRVRSCTRAPAPTLFIPRGRKTLAPNGDESRARKRISPSIYAE